MHELVWIKLNESKCTVKQWKNEDRKSTLAKLTKTESERHSLFNFKILCLIKRLLTTVIAIWLEPLNWENMKGSIYRNGGQSKTPNNYYMCSPARNSKPGHPTYKTWKLTITLQITFQNVKANKFRAVNIFPAGHEVQHRYETQCHKRLSQMDPILSYLYIVLPSRSTCLTSFAILSSLYA